MRIRSTMAGLALGVGALFLTAPIALADTQPSVAPPTSSTRPEPTSSPSRPAPAATERPAPNGAPGAPAPTARPARPQIAEKPRGAAETGGGMQDASSDSTGMIVIGGVALVALAGAGTVAVRRLRKQS